MTIDPTAIVDPGADVDASCQVGPYCIIGPGVTLGPDNRLGPHCVFRGETVIGPGNAFGSHCSIGADPQDLGYQGEPTRLEIGSGNKFGDYVQVTRGSTKSEDHTTRIGNSNFLMAYCHVGHDCLLGDRIVAANAVQLAGHVTVEDRVVFGGLVAVHQFVRVGKQAMIAGGSVTGMDIPPFCRVGGFGCSVYGLNVVGLERAGVPKDRVRLLREAFKVLFRSNDLLEDALARLERDYAESPEAQHWVKFFRETTRGVVRVRSLKS
jgi:UDP-N-acetylglucosamine acyltransferase